MTEQEKADLELVEQVFKHFKYIPGITNEEAINLTQIWGDLQGARLNNEADFVRADRIIGSPSFGVDPGHPSGSSPEHVKDYLDGKRRTIVQ